MTISTYEIQSVSAQLCSEARVCFEEPKAGSVIEAVGCLVLARLCSFAACAKAIADTLFLSAKRVFKIVAIPLSDFFSLNSLVRTVIAAALAVALTALRILLSCVGTISPELTYGLLRLHRFLLFAGLIYRSQFPVVGELPPPLDQLGSRINDQRWRWAVVINALQRVNNVEAEHGDVLSQRFNEDIWAPAARETLAEELATLLNDFGAPAVVPHPVLEEFQTTFAERVHGEALSLCREGLYTKDEVEDSYTAFLPVMYRTTYKAIVDGFRWEEKQLSLQHQDITVTDIDVGEGRKVVLKEVVLADGTSFSVKEEALADGQRLRSEAVEVPIGLSRTVDHRRLQDGESVCLDTLVSTGGRQLDERSSGGLEVWKNSCLEIVLLSRRMEPSMREALLAYLCADEERIHRVYPQLPPLSSNPVLHRCFRLIVEFFTTFVSHHLPSDTNGLQTAFTLSEIS